MPPGRSRAASFRTLALVVIVLSSRLLSGAAAGTRGCRAQCQQECPSQCGSLETGCGPCVSSQMDLRRDCRNTVDRVKFPACVNQRCNPGTPGRCTLTRECVDGCRTIQGDLLGGCDRRFRAGVRACSGGPSCLAAERVTNRRCVKGCRHSCVASCRGAAGTTTPGAATLASGCDCQGSCINVIASLCYGECADQCDGDGVALGVCERACRDQQCDQLTKACTDDGTGKSSYARCCARCDNCSPDLADRFACIQVTTTTRPTTTTESTTTTTSTTSTTFFFM